MSSPLADLPALMSTDKVLEHTGWSRVTLRRLVHRGLLTSRQHPADLRTRWYSIDEVETCLTALAGGADD